VITEADTTKAAVTAMRSASIRMKARSGDILFLRHGRACPGHPRLYLMDAIEDVDARHKAGHDE
jgi:hypothetical protein